MSNLGIVAENSRVCRCSGISRMISFSCSAKPISNNRSASSNTKYSTFLRLNVSISLSRCIRLFSPAPITSHPNKDERDASADVQKRRVTPSSRTVQE